ncbi:carbohydrate ABC transporter permease [Georgenia deserti]|uniref:Carbohydrate ABC transporter permease n=1 Tax=Georgenia deserti TaxID=2093781 RepID=A0ABW4KY22_9MICO
MFDLRRRSSTVAIQVIVTVMIIPFVFPLIAMVRGSLEGQGWQNYLTVLSVEELPLFFRNSIVIALGTLVPVYLCTMLAAFGFSKLRIPFKELYFWLLIATLALPEVVLLTPMFTTAMALNLYNTYLAVIIPLAALQLPFTVLLTRNFVNGIPDELIEAAELDGASLMRTFTHVLLPLTKPIAAAVIVLTVVTAWNNFLLPLVFLQDASHQTITQLPLFFVGEFSNDQTKVLAAAVVTIIPEVITYIALQKYFERGMAAGAIK